MSSFFTSLTPSAQTAYAQAFDHAMMASLHRSVGDLTGSFATKKVAGKEYRYFQFRDVNQKVRQVYLGPPSERLDRLIEAKKTAVPSDAIARQARAALALGNQGIPRDQFKVLKRLDEYGFFRAGGVLIGTHAFICYGNMFGVAWGEAHLTHDLDFAYAGRNVSLALPANIHLNVHDAITSLEMGFLPASQLDGLIGGTYVVPRNPDFRLDFVTTVGRDTAPLIGFPNLNVAMTPLKFMEYSLEDVRQAALLSQDGTVVVNLPSPARYALHKLIVAAERGVEFRTKSRKDLRQAAALLAFMAEYEPEQLVDAWRDLHRRGKGWRTRFAAGRAMLLREVPEIRPVLQHCDDVVSPVLGADSGED